MEKSAIAAGEVVGGRYRIVRPLGHGGMGTVYLANVEGVAGFEKLVALKVAHPHVANDKTAMQMFLSEARLSALLQHANLAQVYDLGTTGELFFIAMEYIRGCDLRTLITALAGARLPLPVVVAVLCRLLEGLDYAHGLRDKTGKPLKLVHRDVTPANCLISYTGDVKLIDFGIAKAVGQMTKTRTGMVRGKIEYMSPEQARGEVLDRRSDVFAVGIILYELLVGQRPFDADTGLDVMENISAGRFKKPRELDAEVPPSLEAICLRALANDRTARFQTAGEMLEALEQFLLSLRVRVGARELATFLGQVVPPKDVPAPEEVTGQTRNRGPVPTESSSDQAKTVVGAPSTEEPTSREVPSFSAVTPQVPALVEKTETTQVPGVPGPMLRVVLGALGAAVVGALLVWVLRLLMGR